MDSRSAISLISFIIAFAMYNPRVFVFVAMIGVALYLLISKGVIPWVNSSNRTHEQEFRRKMALTKARMFLSPYKNIWGDLKLANKQCSLYLSKDGLTIKGAEKVYPYRKFRILSSTVHDYKDLWDMFCYDFSHQTTYDSLIESCRTYKLFIYEYANLASEIKSNDASKARVIQLPTSKEVTQKLDINNCSEIELTALPGISIVMAKKAIKKREEIGGFKNVEEFFVFMKLKPHMESQLREKITVKKMKKTLKVSKNSERSVDL